MCVRQEKCLPRRPGVEQTGELREVLISRQGDAVFTAAGATVCVRHPHTLDPLYVFPCVDTREPAAAVAADVYVSALELSPDERVLAVALSSGAVRLWPLPHWAAPPGAADAAARTQARLGALTFRPAMPLSPPARRRLK